MNQYMAGSLGPQKCGGMRSTILPIAGFFHLLEKAINYWGIFIEIILRNGQRTKLINSSITFLVRVLFLFW